jgi:hypothetical protein
MVKINKDDDDDDETTFSSVGFFYNRYSHT